MTVTVGTLEAGEAAKARGAFYTPSGLTEFLARWAVRTADDVVLEPSAGDGAFLRPLLDRFTELGRVDAKDRILAIEREEAEAAKSRLLAPAVEVRAVDFFDLDPAEMRRFTAVVGNPPYIRYHGFTGDDRAKGLARAAAQGVSLSRLASSWAHFVVHAAGFLEDEGRLALVLPAELLHTDYAAPVREFLTGRFSSVTVVAFDRSVFRSAQVDAVLLLASNDGPTGFQVARVKDEVALSALELSSREGAAASPRWSSSVIPDAGTVYADALASGAGQALGTLAHVDIGFVSGANDFFVLSRANAAELGLPDNTLIPALRRPSDVPGLVVRDQEVHVLLHLPKDGALDDATLRYLRHGEAQSIDQRFKCRARRPWYAVPLPKRTPDAFLPYMHHLAPRLIPNSLGARNSNLLHGVALKPDAPPADALSVAMASSLTLLSAEIEGRAYGGGVLKLETKEAERLIVPAAHNLRGLEAHLPEIDILVRTGELERAALIVDALLGLPHDRLWAGYSLLRARRLGRKRRSAV